MEKDEDIKQQVLQSTLIEVSNANTAGDIYADPCVICLESVTEKASTVPCRHESFDFLCLVSWLEEKPTCPLCKAQVEAVEYDWQSPKDFKTYVVKSTFKGKDVPPASGVPRREQTRLSRRHNRPRRVHAPERAPTLDEALLRRRHVYKHQLYSLHVGSNRLSRFQDLTPAKFSDDEELISRSRKWIRRELQVFEFLRLDSNRAEGVTRKANNAEFLLEYIVAILKTVDIKGSRGQAEDMLQEFLGRDNTRLFLHELRAWLRSPYTSLESWDRHVQYNEAHTTTEASDGLSTRQQDQRYRKRKHDLIQGDDLHQPHRGPHQPFVRRGYDRYIPD